MGCYIWYSEEGPGWAVAPPSPLAVPNVTAHPSTASVPTSYYWMWHYNYLWTLKGYRNESVLCRLAVQRFLRPHSVISYTHQEMPVSTGSDHLQRRLLCLMLSSSSRETSSSKVLSKFSALPWRYRCSFIMAVIFDDKLITLIRHKF